MRISKILGAVAYAFLALSLSLLGACGGGGGGGGGGASSAKAITAFSLAGVAGTINETTKQIAVTVPNGTDVTNLIATFTADQGATVTIGATAQVSGTTANNFTNPVTYTVTAADTTAATYTVTVIVAANSAKAITAFSLAGVTATINETTKQIAVTVPNGTNVTSLIATFTTTGSGVAVGATAQVSGTTPNDFTSPVTYTVTAADSSTATYVVTVAVAPSPAKAITAFSLAGQTGTINETTKQIAVQMPYGTNATNLIATFTTTGASVAVGATAQVSGTTPNDFTNPVTYTVTAADGTTQNYVVTVAVALNPAKAITAYSLAGVTATVNETTKQITVTMPYGTNVTNLIATFTTTGASVAVGATAQISGTTPNNFTNPVTYRVTAANGTTQDYVVTVAVALNPAKAITAFSLAGVTGTINETNHTIAVAMPFGTNVTNLVATFTTTGASVAVGATAQISGTTQNNFTNPVTYRVTAADSSTQDYVVTVTVAANPAKAITAFSLAGVTGTINETNHTIAVAMPFGTNVTNLVATFTTTGASVAVGATAQISGTTQNNFTNPVTYRVTAADSSTQDYVVTVTVALNSAKAITAFSLSGVTGSINEGAHTIAVTVPNGTDVTALAATFTTTGASVAVGATTQTSGTTQNNFTNPVTYTVTAADSSTQNYVVTVTVAPASSAFTAGTSLPVPPRSWHTATPIVNSTKVLVAGGLNWGGLGIDLLDTAVVYDVGTGNWTATLNNMADIRRYHTATLLQDGRVLVAGGLGNSILNSATIYDPATNTWTSVNPMGTPRANHTATPINGGTHVLVTGGFNETGPGGSEVLLATAEIYTVATNTWTPVATPMSIARTQHTAVALADGRVLVLGGWTGYYLNNVEIFDPAGNAGAGAWVAENSMLVARDYSPTATLLPDGRVLVVGGINDDGRLSSAEVYSPSAHTWTLTGGLNTAREWHTATLLPDGTVLATGGQIGPDPATVVNTAETYNPATNNWTAIGPMTGVRASHTATRLSNGHVLIVGGSTVAPGLNFLPVATVEIY